MRKNKKKHKSIRAQIFEKLIDIGLIIISVYIALTVEAWAEKKQEHKRLMEYYQNFVSEIKQDTAELKSEQLDAEKHIKNSKNHIAILKENGSPDSILSYIRKMFNSTLFASSNMISYKSMLASGDMKLMDDLDMRKSLVEIDGAYIGIKIQEDMYLSFINDKLSEYISRNFDLVTGKPLNPLYYKQVEYKNLVALFLGLNVARIQKYEDGYKIATSTLKKLEKQLKQ